MTEKEKKEYKEYNDFLEMKKTQRIESGFAVEDADINPALFDFQKYCVKRALAVGKFALFEDCGLGKTIQQLDTIERAIILWSNEGDTVLTPFLGIGSEVYEAVKLNRFGIGFELKESYFKEAIKNIKGMEQLKSQKTLFD